MKVNIYKTLVSTTTLTLFLLMGNATYSQNLPTQEELDVCEKEYKEIIENTNLPLNFPQRQVVNVDMNLPKPTQPNNHPILLIKPPLIPWMDYKKKEKTHEKN
tara:strand:+ start:1277 stop:1585 length:309 start_codon:yes stop_codon:yes gene_type:complete